MKYSIGLVSKLLGLSAEGLRLYERMGILQPERDPKSGYRYYHRLDLTALLRARSYQQYGFSLHEIQRLLHEADLGELALQYRQQEQALQLQILQKQRELLQLQRIQQEMAQFPHLLGVVQETIRPAMRRLEYLDGEELLLTPEQYPALQKWISLAPLAFSSLRNDWQAMVQQEDRCYSGIAMWQEDVEALGLESELSPGTSLPSCRSLCTVVAVEETSPSCVSYLAPLAEYVQRYGYTATGDPISASILSFHKSTRYTRYRKVWLPIE